MRNSNITKKDPVKDLIMHDLQIIWNPEIYQNGRLERTIRVLENLYVTYSVTMYVPHATLDRFEVFHIEVATELDGEYELKIRNDLIDSVDKIINPEQSIKKYFELN